MFEHILKQLDLPPYRIKQINHAVFKELIYDWEQATALPADLREYLRENVALSSIEPVKVLTSERGDTIKVAFRAVGNDKLRITNYELDDEPVGADPRVRPPRPPAGQTSNNADNMQFESVLMMHDDRNTVCVSSQIGCPVGCAFCATGKMGFKRNLNYREIVDQILFWGRYLKYGAEKLQITNYKLQENINIADNGNVRADPRVRPACPPAGKIGNIVFMGMGEPMLNIANVSKSIDILTDDKKFALGKRRITISTSGYIEPLREFLKKYPHIGLAISLHAPNQSLREKLMPTAAKTNHIDDLIAVAREYSQSTKRRVSFEYILIEGTNDNLDHAHQLAQKLRNNIDNKNVRADPRVRPPRPLAGPAGPAGRNFEILRPEGRTRGSAPTGPYLFHINLIPYNPVANLKSNFKKPNTHRVNRFADELKKLGIPVSIRVSMGDDIAAACGQLVIN